MIYERPFSLTKWQAQGFNKIFLTILDLTKEQIQLDKNFLAFKLRLVGEKENSLIKDFYWEGFSVLPVAANLQRKDPP